MLRDAARWFFLQLALALPLCAQGPGMPAGDSQASLGGADRYLQQGLMLYAQGELDEAIAAFNRAIRLDPANGVAYYSRASAYAGKGDSLQAVKDFNKAILLAPRSKEAFSAHMAIAQIRLGKKELNGALVELNAAIKVKPDNAGAYYQRGKIRVSKGDSAGALADFSQAIKYEPRAIPYYRSRGALLLQKGDLTAAAADLDMAVQLDKYDPASLVLRGDVFRAQGKLDQALADYGRAIQLNPAWASAIEKSKSENLVITGTESSDKR